MTEPAKIHVPDRVEPRDRAVVPMPANPNATPMQMLAIAVAQGADIDKLEKLMALSKQWEENEARKAYVEAMANFKAEPITILKTKNVKIPNGPQFKHATLAGVVDGVVSTMSKFGLSHNWITEQTGELIKVTCVITHKLGHSEKTELVAAPDTGPGRNKIQAVGSTITYLQRYTLMAACGLAAQDMDDDGNSAGAKVPAKEAQPEGYEDWTLNMEAVAEEGTQRLQDTWQKSSDAFRKHTVKYEGVWWASMKSKASKVKQS